MLFATLDPTLRKVVLPDGQSAILSDTVGFISDLPTHLIAAFRATLEEVVEADLIIHVRDMSDVQHREHAQNVLEILASLGVDIDDPNHIIEVWNKVDLLDEKAISLLRDNALSSANKAILVSALTSEGIDTLLSVIGKQISGEMMEREVLLKPNEFYLLDWFYNNAGKVEQTPQDDGTVLVCATLNRLANDRLNKILSGKDKGNI